MDEITTAPAEQQADGPNPQVQDAEAVLRKNQELLAEVKRLKAVARQAEGFDFDKARQAMDTLSKIEEERLTRKGEFDKLLEQRQKAFEERLHSVTGERDQILANLKREKLAVALVENGVLADRARYLVSELEQVVELSSDENGFSLRKRGGIGDAAEFDQLLAEVKARSPFFFAANGASGSGASGNQSAATPSAHRRSAMTVAEKTAYIARNGKDAYLALPE